MINKIIARRLVLENLILYQVRIGLIEKSNGGKAPIFGYFIKIRKNKGGGPWILLVHTGDKLRILNTNYFDTIINKEIGPYKDKKDRRTRIAEKMEIVADFGRIELAQWFQRLIPFHFDHGRSDLLRKPYKGSEDWLEIFNEQLLIKNAGKVIIFKEVKKVFNDTLKMIIRQATAETDKEERPKKFSLLNWFGRRKSLVHV